MNTRSKTTTTTTTTTSQQKEIYKCTGNWMTIKKNNNSEEEYILNEGVDPQCIWKMPVKEKHLDGSVTIKYEQCKLKNTLFCVNFKKLKDLLTNVSTSKNTFLLNSFQKYKENIKNYTDNNCTLCHFHNTKFFGVKVFFRKLGLDLTPLRLKYKENIAEKEYICLKSDKSNIIYLGDLITQDKNFNGKLVNVKEEIEKNIIYKSKFIINKKNLRKIKCDADRPLRI